MRDPVDHLSVNEANKPQFQRILKLLGKHIVNEVGDVRLMLQNVGRETYSQYVISDIRPYRKGEFYLDGSNHIANIAERDGDNHWVQIILERR